MAQADLSVNLESGDGVLIRITLQAVGVGTSILDLTEILAPGDGIPLIGGAWLLKRSAAMQMAAASSDAKPQDSPAHALQATADGLDELLRQLDQTSQTQDRLRLIVEGVAELQRTHVAAFVDARDKLVAEFGIGGMAELMDQFSRAERQINRAWSAACDGHEEEALLSVQAARPLLDAPLEKLQKEDA